MKNKKIVFLTLYTFSLTGGIEKVCKVLIDVCERLLSNRIIEQHLTLSLYDKKLNDTNYLAYDGGKLKFSVAAIQKSLKADLIILSHINLLIYAKIIKFIQPKKRIVLLAHGIEVWRPLASWKKRILSKLEIWAVSNYTAEQLKSTHKISKQQINVLNNCLEADFKFIDKKPSTLLLNKYNINTEQKILLTICRLSSAEKYKGYDLVLKTLPHHNLYIFLRKIACRKI